MPNKKRITVQPDGPYEVAGNIPLAHKTQIVSEYGEPLTWRKDGMLEVPEEPYLLCRCGKTHTKPFCDYTHQTAGFDGTETADTDSIVDRQGTYPGGTGIEVSADDSLCMDSGFCGTRFAHISGLVADSGEPQVRAQLMRMIEHCPSGSLTYKTAPGGADVEPDLPEQVAVTTEITSSGPIDGPLWVTGYIPIERADGQPLETRNRVTLCSCGLSHNKPLCDGTHRGDK
jgi:CDGSH-type Zn-finger protein